MTVKKGDIIQIVNESDKWFPAILTVDEVKNWGVQAYAIIPGEEGLAYYRIDNGDFLKVGEADIYYP